MPRLTEQVREPPRNRRRSLKIPELEVEKHKYYNLLSLAELSLIGEHYVTQAVFEAVTLEALI